MIGLLIVLGAWLLLSASIFNTLLLFWLGVTVFLVAERRTGGLYLILCGMFMGSLFFASHTVILGHEFTQLNTDYSTLEFWWRVGWIPVIFAPLTWYLVMLWYTGFWRQTDSDLFKRHRLPLMLVVAYAAMLLGLIQFSHALPSYRHMTILYLSDSDNLAGVPLSFILYPPYMLLAILLPMDSMRHALPSERIMGDLARSRARLWLERMSVLLLGVSLAVTGFVLWVMYSAFHWQSLVRSLEFIPIVGVFDLGVTFIIAVIIMMLGQAVVTYEVFSGKVLPRRGFQRHWRNAIIAIGGSSLFIALSLIFHVRPVYTQMMLGAIIALFYALISWRSFVHRDHVIQSLRPFINHQGDALQLFKTICLEMLHTRQACLVPMMSPLATEPMFFPAPYPLPDHNPFLSPDQSLQEIEGHPVYQWGVPVWSTRGLIGVLYIGKRDDGSLYTQEEIDAARAGAERIIDLLAREAMAASLMDTGRKRQIEQRVVDRQTRRVLHDEILPDLHLAILGLGDSPVRDNLMHIHRRISELIHHAGSASIAIPATTDAVQILRAIVKDEFRHEFDAIDWEGDPHFTLEDDLIREVIIHAARESIRNAAIHGRGNSPTRPLHLKICFEAPHSIIIQDDGIGQTEAWQKSTGGLALHSMMVALVGGELRITHPSEGGTCITIFQNTPRH